MPRSLSPEQLKTEADKVYWFHSIDLGDGHYTNGHKTPAQIAYELERWHFPADLTGKAVLDIGCYDGVFSIEAIKRGAKSVLATDREKTVGMSFLLEHDVYPIDFRDIDIYSNDFSELPQFDFVIFAGVLYHIQDQIEALKRVKSKTRELALIETHVDERLGGLLPYMIFYETNEQGGDATNWWGPNRKCLEGMMRVAGLDAWRTSTDTDEEIWQKRVSYLARPNPDIEVDETEWVIGSSRAREREEHLRRVTSERDAALAELARLKTSVDA